MTIKIPKMSIPIGIATTLADAKFEDCKASVNAEKQLYELRKLKELPPEAWVKICILHSLFSISRATTYRWIKKGWLPKPKKFGSSSRIRVGELRQALTSAADFAALPNQEGNYDSVEVQS